MFACCCADAPGSRLNNISQERIVSQAPALSAASEGAPTLDAPERKDETPEPAPAPAPAPEEAAPTPATEPQPEASAEAPKDDNTFTVVLTKDHRKLGMEIGHSETDGILKVQAVRKGTASSDWNASNPDKKICEGYFILEIQDEKVRDMTLEDIRGKLESATEVKLLVSKTQPPSKRFDPPK
mmetsp:Transcript_61025/g.145406  ORF Transcript_61025/g.145406 Transcript_61025/m.145406 type:complete len:183 (-) Transcript_61025:142-690(-)|eukprot:CAMPEP_0178414374 /NCGR_PEP_ID=MMETSP0689_2-20121128/23003_1 /TAXON_ID=160604 /ORGANISM="Amphidinium massartii, Strain CS-259" /LENGTH=182 /DNA_ID=CAMNT_0020035661 /DNA_START=75 /DNA_END=623 /DNA_ORIENTATION=+